MVLNLRLLHRTQSFLLFTFLWLGFFSPLSPLIGVVLFATLEGLYQVYGKEKPDQALPSNFKGLVLLLFIPFLKFFLVGFGGLLPYPVDVALGEFYSYLLVGVPFFLALKSLMILALEKPRFHIPLVFFYLFIMTLLAGRRGWSLFFPLGNPFLGYGGLFLFGVTEILLLLSGGRQENRLSPRVILFSSLAFPLLVLLFMGRLYTANSAKEGGGLLESSLFNFDFSDYLSLESSVSLKDELVLLVEGEALKGDFLIRRYILSDYSPSLGFYRKEDRDWEAPGYWVEPLMVGKGNQRRRLPPYRESRELRQTYYIVNYDPRALLGINAPEGYSPRPNWSNSSFRTIYDVYSRRTTALGWNLYQARLLEGKNPEERGFLEYYTAYGEQEDIQTLALELTRDSRTAYERAWTLEQYFLNDFYYSLNPGTAPDGDQLRYFLYESQKGYCSYFAFAMALMVRSLDIPARVAVGFYALEKDRVLNYYPVNAGYAHAWVEVYFPEYGWIEFDPTSRNLAPDEVFEPFSSPPNELSPYLEELLNNQSLLEELPPPPPVEEGAPKEASEETLLKLLLWLLGLFLVFRSLVGLFLLLGPPKKRRMAAYFHLHLACLELHRGKRPKGQAIREYLEERGSPEALAFLEAYEALRFYRLSPEGLASLAREGRALRRSLLKGRPWRGLLWWGPLLLRRRFL